MGKLPQDPGLQCDNCGHVGNPGAHFCGKCGTRLAQPAATTPPVSTMAPVPIRQAPPDDPQPAATSGTDIHCWGNPSPVASALQHNAPNSLAPQSVTRVRPLFSVWDSLLSGAIAGFVAFCLGEAVGPVEGVHALDGFTYIWRRALFFAMYALGLGMVILAADNLQSLRGRWQRDLMRSIPVFAKYGIVGGFAGQAAYNLVTNNSFTRAIAWSLMGLAVGAAIGVVRKDRVQAWRGALGGVLGGFAGGLIFNSLLLISSTNGGAFSRAVGLIITGAMIALLIRLVQDLLKTAWLVGTTTGPYEGKEYPLNKPRVTVGRSELNDVSLYRQSELPMQNGALVCESGQWEWEGEPVEINGTLQSNARLSAGDSIKFAGTVFRFQMRNT